MNLFKNSKILIIFLQVSKERGEELAIEYGIKFMETSAKASINVEEAFFTLARDIKCKMEKRLVNIMIFFYYFFLVKSHSLYYTTSKCRFKSIFKNSIYHFFSVSFLPTSFCQHFWNLQQVIIVLHAMCVFFKKCIVLSLEIFINFD